MKKVVFIFSVAVTALISSCGGGAEKLATPAGDTTAITPPATTPAPDSGKMAAATPAIKDSVMQFKEGKVLISVNGSWSALTASVTTTNGRKVDPNGEVSKGGKKKKLEEGMMIDKDGQLMDKDGKPVDNTGWE